MTMARTYPHCFVEGKIALDMPLLILGCIVWLLLAIVVSQASYRDYQSDVGRTREFTPTPEAMRSRR